jgi:DNA primase
MLTQARPLWQALPDGALRAQVLSALAERARMALDELARLWGRPDARSRRPSHGTQPNAPIKAPGVPPGLRTTMPSPQNTIAAMLFAASHLWEALSAADRELLLSLDPWHGDALRWLDRHLENHGAQPWPALRQDLDAPECAAWAGKARALVDGADVPLEYGMDELQHLLKNLAAYLRQPEAESVKRAVMQQPNRF